MQSRQVSHEDCLVSVVIPSHKRVDHLAQCLRAIRDGTYQPLEILVIDKSFNYEEKRVCDTFSATYIACQGSITHALNKGIECAGGNIVALTDDDAIPDNDWVESIIKCFAKKTDVGVVGGPAPIRLTKVADVSRIVLLKIPLISTVYESVVLDGQQGKAIGYLTRSGETVHSQKIPLSPIYVDFVPGCNMAVRRDVATGTGGFCTLLIGHSEYWEVDFCIRVRRQGFCIVFDPQVRVTHKVAGGTRRPFFDRCYNYVMFFLMNRKEANLSTLRFFINLVFKNIFYVTFPLLKREARGYFRNFSMRIMPLVATILALKDYARAHSPYLQSNVRPTLETNGCKSIRS